MSDEIKAIPASHIGRWEKDFNKGPKARPQRGERRSTSKRNNPKLRAQEPEIVCCAEYPDCDCDI